jgi:hypothetical protein
VIRPIVFTMCGMVGRAPDACDECGNNPVATVA